MKLRFLVNLLNAGSFMILVTAISTTVKRVINFLKSLAMPPRRVQA